MPASLTPHFVDFGFPDAKRRVPVGAGRRCVRMLRSQPCTYKRMFQQFRAHMMGSAHRMFQMWWWVAFYEVLAFVESHLSDCVFTRHNDRIRDLMSYIFRCKRGFSCQEQDFLLRDHVVSLHISWHLLPF